MSGRQVPVIEWRELAVEPRYAVGTALDELVEWARSQSTSADELREWLEDSIARADEGDE